MNVVPGAAAAGQLVEVRTRFDGRWAAGFRVVGRDEIGYVLARVCDGSVLQARFAAADVRPAGELLAVEHISSSRSTA